MRNINTQDAFKMARLIKHSDLKDVLIDYYEKGKNPDGIDIEKFGMNVIFDIVACLSDSKTENDFYELISGICEKTSQEIKEQSITETIEDIKAIAKENDLKSFFTSVSAMISNISI